MALRSGKRLKKEEEHEVEIPATLPRTKTITNDNTSCRLLRLPAELKNNIYRLVLGGRFLHVCQSRLGDELSGPFSFVPCRACVSETEVESIFKASTTALQPRNIKRHAGCVASASQQHQDRARQSLSYYKNRGRGPRIESLASQELTMLRTCRQVYSEAKYILWEATVFSFNNPSVLRNFMYDVQRTPTTTNIARIRGVHLDMAASVKADEAAWNAATRVAARRFRSLTTLYVTIDQRFQCKTKGPGYWGDIPSFRPYSNPNAGRKGNNTFFQGLYEFRNLPLETLSVVVYSTGVVYAGGYGLAGYEGGWSHAQRQVWARYVKDVLLCKQTEHHEKEN